MKIITKRIKSKFRQCLYPYEDYHSKGFYICKGIDRRLICLLRNRKHRTIAYSRYLWEVSHKRKVNKGYEVDHIDGDKTNDVLDNLQVLSKKENKLKEHFKDLRQINDYNRHRLFLWCPVCNKRFKKRKCFINISKLKKGKEFHFCCRSCQVRAQHLDYNTFEKQKYKKIKQKSFEYKNQCENFKEFSKPIFIEKKVKVCDCGNKLPTTQSKYCCQKCRIKYSNYYKVKKKKLIKYCKRSLKKFGRYNCSWIGRKLRVTDGAVRKNIIKYNL